jgi:hypothetical protein
MASGNVVNLDSLLKVADSSSDTIRIIALNEIAKYYSENNTKLSMDYARTVLDESQKINLGIRI